MTDITELAQSLKAAAEKATQGNWRAFQYHDGRCGIGGGHHDEIMVCEHISKERPHDAMFIALANPANVLALVEALEKAQTKAIERGRTACELFDEVTALRQRIAELESRTVKLPKPISVLHRREFTAAHCAIYAYPEAEVNAALDGAGIKWEAE
ncbi:TPA: ead/Ea22-like family protein [Klebsiella pneumoniae]|nr:ead/Ea22-like family protein [Klebsiella pneumoniae]